MLVFESYLNLEIVECLENYFIIYNSFSLESKKDDVNIIKQNFTKRQYVRV